MISQFFYRKCSCYIIRIIYYFVFTGVYPESCESECRCYSNRHEGVLVADCSHSGLTKLPASLPEDLDWLYLPENKISLSDAHYTANYEMHRYLYHISKLDMRSNAITNISSKFLDIFVDSNRLLVLDISYNNLTTLPDKIKNLTSLEKININRNQFTCQCDNYWMRDWILNNTEIVNDYKVVTCEMPGGKWIPVIKMSEEDMGCHYHFPLWTISSKFSEFNFYCCCILIL